MKQEESLTLKSELKAYSKKEVAEPPRTYYFR